MVQRTFSRNAITRMKITSVILFVILSINKLIGQEDSVQIISISTLQVHGILLDKNWKFQAGDHAEYADPGYDDSNWEPINPTPDIGDLPHIRNTTIGWLRFRLRVDSALLNKPLAFQVRQHLASEIYLNGVLVKKYGVVSANPLLVDGYQPQYEPFGVQFTTPEQVIAVRVSFQPGLPYFGFVPPFNGFILVINDVENVAPFIKFEMRFDKFNYIDGALFLLLFLIHLSFFIVYPKQKANLYFGLSTFFIGIGNLLYVAIKHSHDVDFIIHAAVIDFVMFWSLYGLFLFLAIHTLFSSRKGFSFWFIVALFPLGIPLLFLSYKWGYVLGMLIPLLLAVAEASRISIQAMRHGKRGVGIVIAGLASFFVFFLLFHLMLYGILPSPSLSEQHSLRDLIYHLSAVSIPVTLSIYLSLQYAYTSKDLEKKLAEVQQLSQKTIAQEQERQQLLANQNELLEMQVAERTTQIVEQKEALQASLQHLKSTQAQLIQSEKMASLGELTAGIAHEIQNPLNFINNFSEINTELIDELTTELAKGNMQSANEIAGNLKENEQKINSHGKRADAIVKGMLQHSRSGGGVKEPTDINALADEYLRLAYHGLRAKDKSFNATLKTDFDEHVGAINIIPRDIGRGILNLVNNAFYTVNEKKQRNGEGYEPTVSVSSKKLSDKVEVRVKDNGDGMPQKVLDKIFQPFFTTKPPGQGTGLGLSLAYDIVKAHGGELKVETSEGAGSEFVIQLPVG
jgi:two-component system NtrC family sensor kinase